MVDKVNEYGYKKIGFILDRGYFSKDNIRDMEKNHHEFAIMVKGCKSLVSSLIESVKNSFETNRSCSIRAYKTYGTTVKTKLFEDDIQDRYFHIYYNPAKQAAEREQLEQKLDNYEIFLKKNEVLSQYGFFSAFHITIFFPDLNGHLRHLFTVNRIFQVIKALFYGIFSHGKQSEPLRGLKLQMLGLEEECKLHSG